MVGKGWGGGVDFGKCCLRQKLVNSERKCEDLEH